MLTDRTRYTGLLLLFLVVAAWTPNLAPAQDPADGNIPPPPAIPGVSAPNQVGRVPDYIQPQAHKSHRRRSIVHHYPYPYPGYYQGDETAGFRNPGGVGRYAEYYPAGDRFQVENDPVRRAQFDRGGGAPDRSEQLAAESLGIQRANSIQQHIDNYAMPHYGFGFGVGGFGGFY